MAGAVLYDYPRSSAAYRVRIALALKGIAYERRRIDLLASEQAGAAYRAVNPQGLVPMLEVDGARLTQSLAIIDYLDATHPDPPLVPKEPVARSHVLAMALVVAADIHPLNNLRVLRRLKAIGLDEAARDDWYRHWVAEGFAPLEAMAAAHAGRFLFGDTVSLADICLVPQMVNARRLNLPLAPYPTLVRVDAEAMRLAAFADTHADRLG